MTAQVIEGLAVDAWIGATTPAPTSPAPAPQQNTPAPSLRERVLDLCATVSTPEWSDAWALRLGQELALKDGRDRDERRRGKERAIINALDTAYSTVYWIWALQEQHGGAWRKIAADILPGALHTWDNKASAMLSIHEDLREGFKVWPSMYIVVGTALKDHDAQESLLGWAEARLLAADDDEGAPGLTVAHLREVAQYMAENGLVDVPDADDLPTSGSTPKDEVVEKENALREGVQELSALVNSATRQMLDLTAGDEVQYAKAMREANELQRKRKAVVDALGMGEG